MSKLTAFLVAVALVFIALLLRHQHALIQSQQTHLRQLSAHVRRLNNCVADQAGRFVSRRR